MKSIWCLFCIEGLYDQPFYNLFTWWSSKPTANQIKDAIDSTIRRFNKESNYGLDPIYDKLISIDDAKRIEQGEEIRHESVDYRLQEVNECEILGWY